MQCRMQISKRFLKKIFDFHNIHLIFRMNFHWFVVLGISWEELGRPRTSGRPYCPRAWPQLGMVPELGKHWLILNPLKHALDTIVRSDRKVVFAFITILYKEKKY